MSMRSYFISCPACSRPARIITTGEGRIAANCLKCGPQTLPRRPAGAGIIKEPLGLLRGGLITTSGDWAYARRRHKKKRALFALRYGTQTEKGAWKCGYCGWKNKGEVVWSGTAPRAVSPCPRCGERNYVHDFVPTQIKTFEGAPLPTM